MSKKKKIKKLAKKDRPYKNILKQRDERLDYDDKGNVQGFQTRVSQKDKLLKQRDPLDPRTKKGTKAYYDFYAMGTDSKYYPRVGDWLDPQAESRDRAYQREYPRHFISTDMKAYALDKEKKAVLKEKREREEKKKK